MAAEKLLAKGLGEAETNPAAHPVRRPAGTRAAGTAGPTHRPSGPGRLGGARGQGPARSSAAPLTKNWSMLSTTGNEGCHRRGPVPACLRGGEGRSPPSTSGARPAPAAPRPALAKPRPEAPRGARAPPGELSGTTAQTGRRREGENRVPSSAQLDSFEHSDSRSPVLKPEVNLGWGPEVCIY